MIDIRHVPQSLDSFRLFDDCTPLVAKGSVAVACGQMCSGTSALMRSVNGEAIHSGEIIVHGNFVYASGTDQIPRHDLALA